MTLYETQKGKSYHIDGLYVEPAVTRRLQALGLNDGTTIRILNRKRRGALIIQVRGTRLALGRHIAASIQVSQVCEEEAQKTKDGFHQEEHAEISRNDLGEEGGERA